MTLRSFLRGIILVVCAFVFSASSFANGLKVEDPVFDFSDNIILFKTQGELTPIMQAPALGSMVLEGGKIAGTSTSSTPLRNPIRKGILENPARVFFDVDNAILIGAQRAWELKGSIISEVKISQNSLNPNVVRITLNIKNQKDATKIHMTSERGQLLIKYGTSEIENPYLKEIYKNYKIENYPIYPLRASLINKPQAQEAEIKEVSNEIKDENKQNEPNILVHNYFLNEISTSEVGAILKGLGVISIKNVMILEDPKRLVIDLDDGFLNDNLKGKTFELKPKEDEQKNILGFAPKVHLKVGQFDPNTLRLVLSGELAPEYRLIISPDLKSGFLARGRDIINSQIVDTNAKIQTVEIMKTTPDTNLMKIQFENPVAVSVFEANDNLHVDILNSFRQEYTGLLKYINSYPAFKNTKITQLALDKIRFSIPTSNRIISTQISPDSKNLYIYLKKPSIIKRTILKEKIKPSVIESKYRVMIDPGHGGSDSGAIRENTDEKAINQAIAKMVVNNLKDEKIAVWTTIPYDKTVSLQERVEYAEKIQPDIYVSIHSNSSMKPDIKGVEVHWWREDSFELAQYLRRHLADERNLKKWDTLDRGLFKSQFYVINHTTMPAILIEVGFMSNKDELKNLKNKKVQKEMAEAITEGILEYLKKRGK